MPSVAITRPYEAVYILDPDSGEEQIASVTARYRGLVETQGGQVQKIDVWERRKLAYEVKGRTEGIYVVMQFTGTASVEAELRRIFQISEDQIRYLIVKTEETDDAEALGSAASPAAQRSAVEAAPEAPAPAEAPAPVETSAAPVEMSAAPVEATPADTTAAVPSAEAEPVAA